MTSREFQSMEAPLVTKNFLRKAEDGCQNLATLKTF